MRVSQCICVAASAMALSLVLASVITAQVNTATLTGQVVDPAGAAVKSAKVTARNKANNQTRSTETDETGSYILVGLPPGSYEVVVEGASGFAKLVNPEIILTIGSATTFHVKLELQRGSEGITVTEAPPVIEVTRTAVAETVDQRRINNLPINGRRYTDFTLTDSRATRDSAPSIGAAPTSGINFGGQRARSNQVSVDGADAVDNSVNGIRATVSQEAVQEFQLIMSNYMPEFGRATGGVINIVTKGGTNETHGNLFGFLRHKSIQARNAFSAAVDPTTGALVPVKQAYTRVQAGATLGGPIVQDKTFYFLSYETTRRQETGFSSIGVNNFGLVPATFPAAFPGVTLLLTPQQQAFITNPAVLSAPGGAALAGNIFALAGSASSVGLTGMDPGFVATGRGVPSLPGARFPLPIDCPPACSSANLVPLPRSFTPLNSVRGNYPVSEGTTLLSARMDHHWSQRNSSFVRANVSPSLVTGIQVNAQNQNFGQNAGSRTSLQQTRDVSVVGQHVTTFTNSIYNEARFQFARRGLHYGFSQLPGGDRVAVNMAGSAFFGREPFSTVDRIERRFQWTDNVSWIKGRHNIKFGGDANLIQLRSKKSQIFELNFGGIFNFGGLDAATLGFPATIAGVAVPGLSAPQTYGLGLPTTFIQGIGTSNRPFGNKALGFFIQDSWKAGSRLTLNYGVRYDFELTPLFPAATPITAALENAFGVVEGIPRDKDNVAPRIGLAWDPLGNQKTLIRAGYGIFYDHPLLAIAFNSFTAEGAQSVQLISAGGTPSRLSVLAVPTALNGASIFQGVVNDPSGGLGYLPNEQRFNSKLPNSLFVNQNFLTRGFPIPILPFTLPVSANFQYAYAQQANLTLEQQLGKDYRFSLGYTYTHGSHLNRPRDINSTNPLLLTTDFRNALATVRPGGPAAPSNPLTVVAPTADLAPVTTGPNFACGVQVFPTAGQPSVRPGVLGVLNCPNTLPAPLASLNGQFLGTAAFFNFFRPSGPNPSFQGLPGIGSYAAQVALAQAAGYPTGFPGVPVPVGGIDNQESTGSSVYHGVTLSFSKRFANHFEFLSSYTWSHAIDDSTDLQTLLEPQDSRKPQLERSNSSFDQRHRWVTSAIFQSPYQRSDDGFLRKFLADFTLAPLFEVSSGRPYTVLLGSDFRLDLSANTGRPSVATSTTPGAVESPFLPGVFFAPPDQCDALVSLGTVSISPPFGCNGNLGRNTFVRPNFFQWDLRVSRKFYFTERLNLEFITDMFNLFNRNNIADVSPLCNPLASCRAGETTASLDPRQFQFALKINW